MSQTNSSNSKQPPSMFSHLREDFLASIVVFLVALPLCIGIASAVGVSPARALLTGIVGGLMVGFFAGSPLQVSGPAAGLFVIIADLIAQGKASFALTLASGAEVDEAQALAYAMMVLGTSVFLAGIFQIAAGKLHLGQWFRAVSPAVIKGMLAGIGILIVVSQFHTMLDHKAMWGDHAAHGGLQYLATIPEAIVKCFSSDTTANHHTAALIGIVTIATIVAWPLVVPKKFRVIPAALVGILVAAGVAAYANAQGQNVLMLAVEKNMLADVTLPDNLIWFELLFDPIVLTGAIVIALVASAETLLCATAVDQLHNGERTNYDKELTAQGIGNVFCGLIGALPMTGVIVRSSANVNSGAKTRLSTILHGAWLLVFVALLPWVLAYIPKAALGALLVHIGIKLVNIKQLKELWAMSRSEVAIYTITTLIIVLEDLLVGVVVGILLSAAKLLYQFSHLELTLTEKGNQARLEMQGSATFLRLPLLAAKLEEVPDTAELHVDFQNLTYVDHACLELLMSWAAQHEGTGGTLVIDWSSLHGRFTEDAKDKLDRAKHGRNGDNDGSNPSNDDGGLAKA